MKKNNNVTIILTLATCISIAISSICLSYVVNHNDQLSRLEKANDNVYGCQYIDSEFEKIREEMDPSEYNYQLGDRTIWYPGAARHGQIEISGDTLVIPAGTYVEVIFAQNMSISPDNQDFQKDREYKFVDPSENAYIIVSGLETGIAIFNVIH